MVRIRAVVCNLHPSFERARLARETLDLLGMTHVRVGNGTDGGDTEGATTIAGCIKILTRVLSLGTHDAPTLPQHLGSRTNTSIQPGSLVLAQTFEAAADKYVPPLLFN